MNLGYFTMPLHPPCRNYVETLKEDREAILLADKLGFTEAYVGEHVTDIAESITDCCVFLASLAHDTKTIKLGTGTVNLANNHPAAIATKVAMLKAFYPAEDYHQDFVKRNPNHPYVVENSLPKLSKLKKQFPELLKKR